MRGAACADRGERCVCVCSVSASVARESVDRELQTYTKYNRECDVPTDVRVGPVLSFRSHPDRSLFYRLFGRPPHPGVALE